ncbi:MULTISPECIES: winged helix DNA-binding domain-containing protein [Actinosynnema]|uniref:winged helix DNA-binding domain-containing protein n=1 Tax=Actinosynnema TaxID=40566 RepID=UPI0020A36CC4|nr:winged helix DNA-binding domain-containing protein [Actinosynnema pretiosum]MCP2097596.1 Winged helix DNA-binding domain-containing protein [Actinosynnema pretiosum]
MNTSVTWDQVRSWRLNRQFLDPRTAVTAGEVVDRLCGVQAQVASSAEFAVATRTGVTGEVARDLASGALVKTWAARGTLHLLRPDTAPDALSLLASARTWERPSWQKAFGATPAQVAALADAVGELLTGAPLSREELATALAADARFAGLADQLRSSWGTLLKTLAWQGVLRHAPPEGNRVAFTAPPWRGLPAPDEAAPRVITAYLGAYGPATPEAFDAWLLRGALRKPVLRGWFAALGDRLATVDVEGRTAHLLAEHVDELAATRPSTSVRLLGAFDQHVLGPGTADPALLAPEHRPLVSRAAGWISPVVVDGGRVTGTWAAEGGVLTVTPFPGHAPPDPAALEAEIEHVTQVGGLGGSRP